MAIYLAFLHCSSKNRGCHAHQSPTHSQCLESWTRQAFGFHPHSLSFGVAMVQNSNEEWSILRTTLLEIDLVGLPNAKKSHTRSQSHFTKWCMRGSQVGEPTTHPPPHPPFPPETGPSTTNLWQIQWLRGTGSTQMQTRNYRARLSGNLARKVRNAFSVWTTLRGVTSPTLSDLISHQKVSLHL